MYGYVFAFRTIVLRSGGEVNGASSGVSPSVAAPVVPASSGTNVSLLRKCGLSALVIRRRDSAVQLIWFFSSRPGGKTLIVKRAETAARSASAAPRTRSHQNRRSACKYPVTFAEALEAAERRVRSSTDSVA